MSYKGIKVVVTGGLGFIGLNLVKALLDAEAQIHILEKEFHPIGLRWLKQIADGRPVELHKGNIGHPNDLHPCLDGCEVVFNLAGRSGASQSLLEAHKDMQVNIAEHLSLLETVRHLEHRPRILFMSSRLVYGVTDSELVNEQAPTEPTSIYGLHKLTVEHYYRLYHLHYGVPYTIIRLTNPYGPYQMPKRRDYGIINRFILDAIENKPLTIYGDGQQLRDYISVEDVSSALLMCGVHVNAEGRTFNLGYGKSIQLAAMAEIIVRVAGQGTLKMIPWPDLARKVETGDFICDISLLEKELDWTPQIDWDTGISNTIRTYRELLT